MTPAQIEDETMLKWVVGFMSFLVVFCIGATTLVALC